ncbi:hypothetical protein OEZ85_001648 [Tetradesmus obliquus]|uniref:Replication factor C C-terminal domain-containing protein n=1 Tax=Tetradesmus obliquus TaxID=3088 RepID=A0ABY8U121_TETOB|nr:hypothetical protein OEZ85_001648 [Tetradesmus obliquus]
MKHEDTMCLLARLAASSKQLRAVAQSMVQQHVGQLLPAVAAAAHSAQKGLRTGHTRASTPMPQNAAQAAEFERTLAQTRWLCSLAGQQALQRNAAAVLGVRRVPKEVAAIVQQAGLQLTTEDLVAAARSRAEGLENWLVEPYCTELHPVVFAVLAGRADEMHGRTDLLKCLASSGAPAERVPKGVLLELLRIAVQRMTGKGVTYICRLLGPHGLSRSEAAALLALNEAMSHAFDQSLAGILQALVR